MSEICSTHPGGFSAAIDSAAKHAGPSELGYAYRVERMHLVAYPVVEVRHDGFDVRVGGRRIRRGDQWAHRSPEAALAAYIRSCEAQAAYFKDRSDIARDAARAAQHVMRAHERFVA